MDENLKNPPDKRRLNELPIMSEDIGFAPEQMISCGKCRRVNPPTRIRCFYCSADLPVDPENAGAELPKLRHLEAWEKGFNVVVFRGETSLPDTRLQSMARELSLESGKLKRLIEFDVPMPLVRTESAAEAEIVLTRIKKYGLECKIVSDEQLLAEKMPRRLRAIEFSDAKLTTIDFNTGERSDIPRDELVLIVSGVLFESRVDDVGQRKSGKTKVLEQSETSTDTGVFDIYTRDDKIGYRITTSGFDFSCLGTEKGILASENLLHLVNKLRDFAPRATFVDDYKTIADLLENVWEVERCTDSLGLNKGLFGKTTFNKAAISNNTLQFTKYSRLVRHFL